MTPARSEYKPPIDANTKGVASRNVENKSEIVNSWRMLGQPLVVSQLFSHRNGHFANRLEIRVKLRREFVDQRPKGSDIFII